MIMHLNLRKAEPVFVNLLGAHESIPSLAEPILRNQFLGSINVYKYGLWCNLGPQHGRIGHALARVLSSKFKKDQREGSSKWKYYSRRKSTHNASQITSLNHQWMFHFWENDDFPGWLCSASRNPSRCGGRVALSDSSRAPMGNIM